MNTVLMNSFYEIGSVTRSNARVAHVPRVAFSPLIASIHLAKTTFHLPRGRSHRRLLSRLGSAERAFANDFLTRESSSSSSSSSSVVPNSRPKRTVSPRVRGTRGGTISPRGNGHLWYLKFGTFDTRERSRDHLSHEWERSIREDTRTRILGHSSPLCALQCPNLVEKVAKVAKSSVPEGIQWEILFLTQQKKIISPRATFGRHAKSATLLLSSDSGRMAK
jgi:hypothetical protein